MFLFGTQDWEAYHQWLIFTKVYKLYSSSKTERNRLIVYMTEDTAFSGLADRIRCFVSGYIIAEENKRSFHIFHNKGFLLEKYLVPNRINWQIEESTIARGLNRVKLLWLTLCKPGKWSVVPFFRPFKVVDSWPGKLSSSHKEYHAYGILDVLPILPPELRGKYSFKKVFDTLFAPSEHLRGLVSRALAAQQLEPGKFIVFHLRFLNFFEPVEPDKTEKDVTGTPEMQAQMIKDVHATIDKVYRESGGCPVLLFSDSNRFLQSPHPDYIKVLPGSVGHVVRHGEDDTITDKAFTDLFVMAQAQQIYSLTGPHIYGGAFARTAADIGGKEYRILPIFK